MIKQVAAAVLASLAVGLAPLASAQAATAAPKPLPNPCKTFTVKSARTLLRVGPHVGLTEKLGRGKHPPSRSCTIKHGKTRLFVGVQRQKGGTGSGETCYKRPKLGSDGMVCVSNKNSPPFSFVVFHKHGIWVSDSLNLRLANKGARLVTFALPQYKNFKG